MFGTLRLKYFAPTLLLSLLILLLVPLMFLCLYSFLFSPQMFGSTLVHEFQTCDNFSADDSVRMITKPKKEIHFY